MTGALVAFGHFFAFFTLTAAIVLKLALLGEAGECSSRPLTLVSNEGSTLS